MVFERMAGPNFLRAAAVSLRQKNFFVSIDQKSKLIIKIITFVA